MSKILKIHPFVGCSPLTSVPSLKKLSSLLFLSLLLLQTTYIHTGKKVSPLAFRQILPKILPVACIFSYTNVTFEKARWN